jgi:RNA polymerase sigma-70 factor (ECF subfamily)
MEAEMKTASKDDTALFSDERLAYGIQHACAEDLDRLVERHHAPLLGFLYRITGGDRFLAEDLVQDTFLRMMSRIDTYRYPRPFKPWLYAIAVNLARDYFKQAELRHTDSTPPHFEVPVTATPETEFVETEETQRVAAAMNRLPLFQREAILLRYFQELSLVEMAQVLQVPVGTVKSRLSLGLKSLKENLNG